MASLLTRLLDTAFGHPHGLLGRLGGGMMARGNAEQEAWGVQQAGLRAGGRVLVVGHGPGIGLSLATEAVHPGGHVIGVDPSRTMREMAAKRCAVEITAGALELRDGTAANTGCADNSMDAAISLNNVMLWEDRAAGFTELHRVLKPGGRLVIGVHRHVLGIPPGQLRSEAAQAGFTDLVVDVRERRFTSPAIELVGLA